jgi:lipopolysaccharide export system ATP-binding protein
VSPTLKARGLTKAYRSHTVVDHVDLDVGPGEVVGLLGPNGAGKTTTFRMILGLLRQDEGQVHFGQCLDDLPLHERARLGLGYLPQGRSVFRGLSVEDNLLALLEALGKGEPEARADRLLARFGLLSQRKQKARTLSGGESRRLEFARALTADPAILLCDEPFSGVDPIAAEEIVRAIGDLSKSGVGILLTDHSVREAMEACTRIYLLVDGQIRDTGSREEILASETARTLYLGKRF